jgi:hypothetical protein
MARDKEPHIWLTVLKLALGAVVIAGLVWLALWYADNYSDEGMTPPLKPKADWGIVNDSPLRGKR